ncbi:nucleotidyl transferase AbiEii/AbiGii toxin family protein [Candidatus Woesearchaeota archaeon]|nr:nucleotidyl transferase AbiEii/AbiGii toxin family protein [Candidatus Woesearchaeota archaeon]
MVLREITQKELNEIIADTGFDYDLLVKDYYITILLYLLKDLKGAYFKGGTALQKTILDYARISEDIDFTLDRSVSDVKKAIIEIINESKTFGEITQDKDVDKFTRLIVPYKTDYGKDKIFIDLNERGKLLLKPEDMEMNNFYPNIPKFTFPCFNRAEMIGEKVAAAIGRNKPRDHYDIYQIIKKKYSIDMSIVEKKCKSSGCDPSIIKMFNNAKKLYTRWQMDLEPLLVNPVPFEEVMQTLSKYFKLKEEKDKVKDSKISDI